MSKRHALRNLTGRVYRSVVPYLKGGETYLFTVSHSKYGAPQVRGILTNKADAGVAIDDDGEVKITSECARAVAFAGDLNTTSSGKDINGMWVALGGTEVFGELYEINQLNRKNPETLAGGRFYDNPHFGVDMYIPQGKCGTVADTLFLCLVWGYLYALSSEDDTTKVGCNMGVFFELSPAGTEIPVAMSNVEGTTVRAGFEFLSQELRDRGVFSRNKIINDSLGFKFKGF